MSEGEKNPYLTPIGILLLIIGPIAILLAFAGFCMFCGFEPNAVLILVGALCIIGGIILIAIK